MIKAVLKDPIFSTESDDVDLVDIERESSTIVDLISEINNRNNDLETSDVNTRRRVKARRRLISKAGSDCFIDQDVSFNNDGKKKIIEIAARQAKSRARKDICAYRKVVIATSLIQSHLLLRYNTAN